MVKREELIKYLDGELQITRFSDSHLNGLQFEGGDDVHVVGAAVDCGLGVVEQACASAVDFLIVHHGLFWGAPAAIRGPLRRLIGAAAAGGLSIYGAHLPLDGHKHLGNNALLAAHLGLTAKEFPGSGDEPGVGCLALNPSSRTLGEIAASCARLEGAPAAPLILGFGPDVPSRVLVVSGAGADALYTAGRLGFDTLITGEPRQFAYHYCRENELNAVFAGHYATETLGVKELAATTAKKFGLNFKYLSFPTGI